MINKMKKNIYILILTALLMISGVNQLWSKDDLTINIGTKRDTVFKELHLSSDGVYGIDSSGDEWEYDFGREAFTKGRERPEEEVSSQKELEQMAEEVAKAAVSVDATTEQIRNNRTLQSALRKIRGLQLGSVTVEEDETVDGPVVAVGPIIVKGLVDGDVISYKRITVTSTGEITGDARAPEILKMRGATISGGRYETDIPKIPDLELFETTSDTSLTVSLSILAGLLFCGFLASAIVRRPLERVRDCIRTICIKSFFMGLLAIFLFAPLFALLCLTIIGIPLAIFVLPIALLGAIIMGTIALGYFIGEKVSHRFGLRPASQLAQVIIGLTVFYIPWIIMSFLWMSHSSFNRGLGTFFMVMAIIINSIGVLTGLGSVIFTRFGSRDCDKVRRMAVHVTISTAPPPPPPSPPPLKPDEPTL